MELIAYWDVLMRRKWRFAVPCALVLAASIAIAFLLPPMFRSEATIMVQRQSIPADLVSTTVTGYVQEQIQQIRQRMLSYQNVLDIAEQFDLYPGARQSDPAYVASAVREAVEVEMVDVRASDPNERGERTATIAFTVAFSASTPEAAQNVTSELTQRFIDLNREARAEQAADVSQFLEGEAETLKAEIAEVESSLASFKQEELHQLPELMTVNLRLFERTEEDIDRSREQIRRLEDQTLAIQSELSLTDPYKAVVNEDGDRLLSASERLSMLTAEYLRASARYSAAHPDIIRLQREISLLAQETGDGGRADELMRQLVKLQEQLRQTREKYSSEHPEVQKLERAVAAVQRGFETALFSNKPTEVRTLPPDNPRYVSLKTQLDSVTSSLAAERQNLESLQAKLQEYEQRLFQTPMVERNFKSLSRDYDNALAKYKELKAKQMEARLAQNLEAGDNAASWELVSSAYLPVLPDSPNRLGIALLGFVLAFGAGIGSVGLAEYSDTTVRGSKAVFNIMGTPPLAIIPDLGPSKS